MRINVLVVQVELVLGESRPSRSRFHSWLVADLLLDILQYRLPTLYRNGFPRRVVREHDPRDSTNESVKHSIASQIARSQESSRIRFHGSTSSGKLPAKRPL